MVSFLILGGFISSRVVSNFTLKKCLFQGVVSLDFEVVSNCIKIIVLTQKISSVKDEIFLSKPKRI